MSKTKINWLQAFQDYIADPRMSLADIAEKYDISLSRVKKGFDEERLA